MLLAAARAEEQQGEVRLHASAQRLLAVGERRRTGNRSAVHHDVGHATATSERYIIDVVDASL